MKTYRLLFCLALLSTSFRAFAAVDDSLPPLPIDRTQPGVASILDDSSSEPVTKKWSMRYQPERSSFVLACTANYNFNGNSGGTTRDYFVPVTTARLSVAAAGFTKAAGWAKLTKERNPPPFRKNLVTVDGSDWVFVWTGDKCLIMAQKVTLSEDDWAQFGRLLPLAKNIMDEQASVQKSAKDFVESLK